MITWSRLSNFLCFLKLQLTHSTLINNSYFQFLLSFSLILLERDFLHQFFNAIHSVDRILRIIKISLHQSQSYQFGQDHLKSMEVFMSWRNVHWLASGQETQRQLHERKWILHWLQWLWDLITKASKTWSVSNRFASNKNKSKTIHTSFITK